MDKDSLTNNNNTDIQLLPQICFTAFIYITMTNISTAGAINQES